MRPWSRRAAHSDTFIVGSRQTDVPWSRWIVERALRKLGNPPIAVVLWNGQEICTSAEPPTARLRFHDRMALWRVALDPRMQFGEMYSRRPARRRRRYGGDDDRRRSGAGADRAGSISGPAARGTGCVVCCIPTRPPKPSKTFIAITTSETISTASGSTSRCSTHAPIFPSRDMTLEQAQVAKMDHVARKLWLQPGEKVIEAGCGWGALALHLARRYGVTVRAFNTSHEQIIYARARARAEGLHDRVEFVEDDWRNIRGCCDAFVSVGMLEHVRPANYRRLGDVIHGCLKPNGRGLIHSIGRNKPQPMDPWIERHIFPGAIPPSLSQMMDIFELHDFSLLDAENLRLHYALTLRHWLAASSNRAARFAEFDERFVRMWRQYLGRIAVGV